MAVAEALQIDDEEVLSWPPDKFARWCAYFKLKRQYELQELKKVGSKAGSL